jgi:hypothetical protein
MNDHRKSKKEDLSSLLGSAWKAYGEADENVRVELRWKGKIIDEGNLVNPDLAREILWEISELNFRVELAALDHYVSLVGSTGRRELISKCFHTSSPTRLYVVNLGDAGQGLGARDLRQRAPYFIALHRLMEDWKDNETLGPALPASPDNCTEGQLLSFEIRNANFYCRTYYRYFCRAPTIPRSPH